MTHTPGPWKLGEENVAGGFNIYAGPLRIAHTAIQARASVSDGRTIADEEAKANARLIVEAVNAYLVNPALLSPGASHFIDRCKSYLDDAPAHGGHSDAAGADAFELIEEAIEWMTFPNSETE